MALIAASGPSNEKEAVGLIDQSIGDPVTPVLCQQLLDCLHVSCIECIDLHIFAYSHMFILTNMTHMLVHDVFHIPIGNVGSTLKLNPAK